MFERLRKLGFSFEECQTLHRIQMTLNRWDEQECGTDNGCIERDEATGKPYWLNSTTMRRFPIKDREAGAIRRLDKIMAQHPELVAYHQGDCRGCSLYILTKEQVGQDRIDSIYTRGVAVCD